MNVVTVFLNARSGTHEAPDVRARIEQRFADAGLVAQTHLIEPTLDLARIVSDAVRRDSIVVAGGGDGTISTVASHLVGGDGTLGVLPIGTMNHFAKDLGIPLDVDAAVATIVQGRVVRVDTGDVNGRPFLNNVAIGAYPRLVETREALKRHGYRKWLAFALAAWHTARHQHRLSVKMEADGQPSRWRTPLVLVGNNAYDVEGLHVSGRSHLDSGLVYAYVAPRLRARDLPATLFKEAFARVLHLRDSPSDAFRTISGAELWLDIDRLRRTQVAIDGEVLTLEAPLHFQSRPRSLQVIVPAA